MNSQGKVVWSHILGDGPLLKSNLGDIDFNHHDVQFKLIPSLDGTLYRYNGHAVEPLPLNVEKLLSNSYKMGDDIVISGSRSLTTFGIDVLTGELSVHNSTKWFVIIALICTGRKQYECGFSGCLQTPDDKNDSRQLLMIVSLNFTNFMFNALFIGTSITIR